MENRHTNGLLLRLYCEKEVILLHHIGAHQNGVLSLLPLGASDMRCPLSNHCGRISRETSFTYGAESSTLYGIDSNMQFTIHMEPSRSIETIHRLRAGTACTKCFLCYTRQTGRAVCSSKEAGEDIYHLLLHSKSNHTHR